MIPTPQTYHSYLTEQTNRLVHRAKAKQITYLKKKVYKHRPNCDLNKNQWLSKVKIPTDEFNVQFFTICSCVYSNPMEQSLLNDILRQYRLFIEDVIVKKRVTFILICRKKKLFPKDIVKYICLNYINEPYRSVTFGTKEKWYDVLEKKRESFTLKFVGVLFLILVLFFILVKIVLKH